MPREWRRRMNADTLPPEDSLLTRRSLLSRLRDVGDDAGWREFFDTYWELIYRVARRSGRGISDADLGPADGGTVRVDNDDRQGRSVWRLRDHDR